MPASTDFIILYADSIFRWAIISCKIMIIRLSESYIPLKLNCESYMDSMSTRVRCIAEVSHGFWKKKKNESIRCARLPNVTRRTRSNIQPKNTKKK